MYSVRFHLARGPHYRYWQIKNLKDKNEAPLYVNPEKNRIVLKDCTLEVNENKAKRVHAAGRKDVCGWIKCRYFFLNDTNLFYSSMLDSFPRLKFNPIIDVNWRIDTNPDFVMNNATFPELLTSGNKVYVAELMSMYAA
jgi:hypothetical protein